MIRRRLVTKLIVLAALAGVAGCGPGVNLSTALVVTDMLSGWYDAGLKDGKTHLVPSFTFRLKNQSDRTLSSIQLTYDFWKVDEDGPFDSGLVQAIGSEGVAAGGVSDSITLRGTVGYTLEGLRSDFFTHSLYRDATIKIFAKRSGTIAPLGEFKIERRLLPHSPGVPRP